MSKASESVRQAIRLLGEENPYGKAVEDLLKERDGLLEALEENNFLFSELLSLIPAQSYRYVRGKIESKLAYNHDAIAKAKGE